MNLSRIRRLLKLLGMLQAGRGYNTEALAQACGVSRRTIFRDLGALRQSGVPLVYDDQHQRYHIPGTYFLPPTNFTAEEALALIVLCHDMGASRQLPFFGPAQRAALKLASNLPDRLRDQVRATGEAVTIRMPPTNPLAGQESVYGQLVKAVCDRRPVRIGYHGPTEDPISTRLHPYQLLFSRRSWYVIGRSTLHRSNRTFNVGRIRELEPLDGRYKIPRGFSLKRYLRNAWHLIPEPGPDREVVVRFNKLVAQNVAEVGWHKTQRVRFNDDGTLDFRVTVSGLKEISWWILGYGDQAQVLRPAELRRIIAGHVARLMEKYDNELARSRHRR
ncbi:MAG: helix-turn-helix transcriptional regulator [Planctomycetota bacterium]|jgi:proteasome accessory factor B